MDRPAAYSIQLQENISEDLAVLIIEHFMMHHIYHISFSCVIITLQTQLGVKIKQ